MTTTTTNKVTFSTFQKYDWGHNCRYMRFEDGRGFGGFIGKGTGHRERVLVSRVDFDNDENHRLFEVSNGNWRSALRRAKDYVRQFADRCATVAAPQDLTGYSWPR